MKRLVLLLLWFVCHLAAAQGIHNHGQSTFLTPEQSMPKGVIHIDKKTLPADQYGFSTIRLSSACAGMTFDQWASCTSWIPKWYPGTTDNVGDSSFRILCSVSHYAFDDPIVKPGAPGTSHLHVFFGNTTTNAASDAGNMAAVGRSTCSGGIVNRTGYWTPAPVYHCPNPIVGCDGARDGEVFIISNVNAYYKTRYDSATLAAMEWFAPGLRMVGGNPSNEDPSAMHGRFDCYPSSENIVDFDGGGRHIPTSAQASAHGCNEVDMLVDMPNCWNGVDLYLPPTVGAPDHSAHVNYGGISGSGCAPIYGAGWKTLGLIGFNVHFSVTNNADWDYIRLSSDKAEVVNTTGSGSTTTVIKLNATDNQVNGFYVGGFIFLNGEKRTISAYSAIGPTVTVSSAFSTAPASGVTYYSRSLAGRSLHADWSNGWSNDPNFLGSGKTVGQMIVDNCWKHVGSPHDRFDCHDDLIGSPDNGTSGWFLLN